MTWPELPDAEALVIGHLADHPDAQAVLALTDDGLANVSSDPAEAPWPACRVYKTPASSDRDLRWLLEPELQLEVWDSPEPAEQLGPAELGRRTLVLARLVLQLPDRPHHTDPALADQPVVTYAAPSVPITRLDDPTTHQPRMLTTLRLVLHPAVPV